MTLGAGGAPNVVSTLLAENILTTKMTMVVEPNPLQNMMRLAALALRASDVQLTVDGMPGISATTDRSIATTLDWAQQSGYANVDATFDGLAEWVRSFVVAPLTGPSGESGFVMAATDTPNHFDDASIDILTEVVTLLESHLDLSLIHI